MRFRQGHPRRPAGLHPRPFLGALIVNGFCATNAALLAPTSDSFGALRHIYLRGLNNVQIPLSAWWLSRHRFGPVEWIWRRLTYGRPL